MKNRIKENKVLLLVSSIVIVLPILMGLLLWEQLPDLIATHFGFDNQPNGWSSKPMTVFGIPLILLAAQWLMLLLTSFDPKQKDISKKLFGLVVWIIPVISICCLGLIYLRQLDQTVPIGPCVNIMLGLVFLVVGNYLPKCRQNYTVGIKLPWTLSDEDNWYHTHRFSGAVWVIGGLLLLILPFLPFAFSPVPYVIILSLLILLPAVYSLLYYFRHKRG